MKALVVEDDFTSRKLLQGLLLPYGECDIAVNGTEALEAFRTALKEGNPYELVCLDIMLPLMDGTEVLREIRTLELSQGIPPESATKVVMTTGTTGRASVEASLKWRCNGYVVKPYDKEKLLKDLRDLGLIR